MQAQLWDAYGKPAGYIDLPNPTPSGGPPAPGWVVPLVLLVGLVMFVMFVFAANEPGPGEPGYCADRHVVSHNSLGVPKFTCTEEVK